MTEIAKGYRRITGKNNPPNSEGGYYVQLRNGMLPKDPWPVQGTRWEWGEQPHDFDIIAVRKP